MVYSIAKHWNIQLHLSSPSMRQEAVDSFEKSVRKNLHMSQSARSLQDINHSSVSDASAYIDPQLIQPGARINEQSVMSM